MSEILQLQMRFAGMVAALIVQAQKMGYGVTLGEAFRSPQEAARLARAGRGIAESLHSKRLAIDLQLFLGGFYLQDSIDYLPLGEWWEGQGGAWGGRFGDGNHFSLAYGGRK